MSRWIKIEDELPQLGKRVMILTSESFVDRINFWNLQLFYHPDGRKEHMWLNDREIVGYIKWVIAWQPVPEIPEEFI